MRKVFLLPPVILLACSYDTASLRGKGDGSANVEGSAGGGGAIARGGSTGEGGMTGIGGIGGANATGGTGRGGTSGAGGRGGSSGTAGTTGAASRGGTTGSAGTGPAGTTGGAGSAGTNGRGGAGGSLGSTGLAGTTGVGGAGGSVSTSLKVQYLDALPTTPTQSIKPHFQILNGGTNPVALSTLTIRYWYTIDTNQPQTTVCDLAAVGCNNVTEMTVLLSSTRPNADCYFQVGFTSGAGNIAASGSSGEIQVWFHKNDWSNYTQTDDYSFDPTKTAYADWNRVTLYQNGTLVWGLEP